MRPRPWGLPYATPHANQKVHVLPSFAFHATSKCDPNAAAVITADSPEVFSLSTLSARETTYIGGFQPPTTVDTYRFLQPLRVLTSPTPLFRRAPRLAVRTQALPSLFHLGCAPRVAPFRGFPDLEPDTFRLALPLVPFRIPVGWWLARALRRLLAPASPRGIPSCDGTFRALTASGGTRGIAAGRSAEIGLRHLHR